MTTNGSTKRQLDELLNREQWETRQHAHHTRVDRWIRPHLRRRKRGASHPVEDFLFDYYSYRPSLLRRWHPGAGVVLQDADEFLSRRGYHRVPDGVSLDVATVQSDRAALVRWADTLLNATISRPPRFNCFGMHEWAMVYRQSPTDVRHQSWPLRRSPREIAEIVDDVGLRCTHFDAFRFFTQLARPLNSLALRRETQPEVEQPGCLHANMDLYKIAYKLMPLLPSELLADCFELTKQLRVLDMRASPYDLASLGYSAIKVEEAAGRAEYVALQREYAAQAHQLRSQLRCYVNGQPS